MLTRHVDHGMRREKNKQNKTNKKRLHGSMYRESKDFSLPKPNFVLAVIS